MADVPDAQRAAVLARRVRWLDRRRRRIAIGASILSLPLVVHEYHVVLGPEWPRAHAIMLAIVTAAVGWWCFEVVLAWLAAMWEAEHDHIASMRGLPAARIHRR